MINAAQAREIIVQSIVPSPVEECSLTQCEGRVLASDIVAPHDVPLFDNSSMDGFAVRVKDIQSSSRETPALLKLSSEIPAGRSASEEVRPGSAMRIMTGAPVPAGADAVVEQEMAETKNGMVGVVGPVTPGRNIRRKGEDIKEGTTVLKAGRALTPARVGVLASLGIQMVRVCKKPRVALLVTGNELVEVEKNPGPGQIRNSNGFTLEGLIRQSGGEPVNLGIVPDTPADLAARLRMGLVHDAVVTSGGISVGKYDLVLETLKSEGVEIRFWKVNIKPGMPMAFGIWNSKKRAGVPVFALPGNPVSSMVTFRQFVRPGLEKLAGLEPVEPLRVKAVLGENIRKDDGKRHFVRGIARNGTNGIIVITTGSQSSGVLTSMATANCLIILPEDARGMKQGDSVEIELL